jgi:hypothetical protein
MVRLYSLFYSEFFYSFLCFFVYYSVIYHCFPSSPSSSSCLFPSIFFDPFHQSLPLCIFHITFGFSFPILPLLFLISCSSFSYSPVGAPSHEHTFFSVFFYWIFHTSSCCLYLFAVSCHYFPPFFFPYILLLLPFLVAFL